MKNQKNEPENPSQKGRFFPNVSFGHFPVIFWLIFLAFLLSGGEELNFIENHLQAHTRRILPTFTINE